MMTDIGGDRNVKRRWTAARARSSTRLSVPAGALLALVLAAAPSPSRAEADGRADWRRPARALEPAPEPTGRSAPSGSASRTEPPPATEPDEALGNAPPVLGGIEPQRLLAGRRWRLHLRARDPDGEPPRVLVRGLPPGSTLAAEGAGWHVLDWTPPRARSGSVDLTVVAVDARDPRLRSERVVRLEIVPDPSGSPGTPPSDSLEPPFDPAFLDAPEPDGVAGGADGPGSTGRPSDAPGSPPLPNGAGASGRPMPPAAPTADAPDVPRLAPRIEPLAAQIVSAGRTVAFRVGADLPDERTALLQIDRLPRNASFDRNADGSRTFHWPTGDTDQGEHRFRITAQHPDDETLASRVDLLVVVGDPTRALTVPLDEGAGERRREAVDEAVTDGPIVDPEDARAGVPADGSPGAVGDDAFDPDLPAADEEEEPFLPQAGAEEPDYFDPELYPEAAEFENDLPPELLGEGGPSGFVAPEGDYFEPPDPGYGPDDLPLGPDGLPFEP